MQGNVSDNFYKKNERCIILFSLYRQYNENKLLNRLTCDLVRKKFLELHIWLTHINALDWFANIRHRYFIIVYQHCYLLFNQVWFYLVPNVVLQFISFNSTCISLHSSALLSIQHSFRIKKIASENQENGNHKLCLIVKFLTNFARAVNCHFYTNQK